MYSTLIVARMNPEDGGRVAELFSDFDKSDLPRRMGTFRRQLFNYKGLYFHLQDFDSDNGRDSVEGAKNDPRFVRISSDLKPFITAYDPGWRTPADAMADRFYHWSAE
ncbi:TcmI family type II polyketide cyclase [Nocardia jinanensis]|uniref:Polyketide synthase n=1 Tax=Nocardia jinanensis TaxID=382504 RepID=A0A917S057_9NOCA|nr:TcmI family type II polyketide cyclase [Nocardia jinanensis]GGL46399.1 polyketide synthase [Nocardia jinanensis]